MASKQFNQNNETHEQLKWAELYPRLLKLKQINDKRKSSPGSKVYQLRMYDLVLNNKRLTMNAKQKVNI